MLVASKRGKEEKASLLQLFGAMHVFHDVCVEVRDVEDEQAYAFLKRLAQVCGKPFISPLLHQTTETALNQSTDFHLC